MGERPNERVIIVGIGWVLLASATSGFSGCIKLAYCFTAKERVGTQTISPGSRSSFDRMAREAELYASLDRHPGHRTQTAAKNVSKVVLS